MSKRKQLTMLVTVSVPADMSATQARREVRELITHQCNHSADFGEVKAISVKPKPRSSLIFVPVHDYYNEDYIE